MRLMKKYEADIFDMLGINGREDSYTNLLKVLFDNVLEYRSFLLNMLFPKEALDPDAFYFETRNKYSRKDSNEKNHNEIPDIIIVDKSGNHFALIEVKIFSGEGDRQTERYYNLFSNDIPDITIHDCNKENIPIRKNAVRKFYFLTIYESKAQCEEFINIKWSSIIEPLKQIQIKNEYLNLLAKSLINKVESSKTIDSISKDMIWNDSMGFGWAKEQNLFKVLKSFCFKDEEIWDYYESWNGYNKDSNTYELKCLFGRECWRGIHLKNINNDNLEKCFEFHYEFAYSPNEDRITVGLDYHLRPYLSISDINKCKFYNKASFYDVPEEDYNKIKDLANRANEIRKNKADEIKNSIMNSTNNDSIIRVKNNSNPMILVKQSIDGTSKKTIEEITKIINVFVKNTKTIIDDFVAK